MLKYKKSNLLLFFLGIIFMVLGAIGIYKGILERYAGLLCGIGAGTFGVTLANIFSDLLYKKNPEMKKLKEIEINDERNKFLHYKTGNTIRIINTYLMCVCAIIIAASEFPVWIKLLLPAILFINTILYPLVFNKNNKSL